MISKRKLLGFALAIVACLGYVSSLAGFDERLDAAEVRSNRTTSLAAVTRKPPPALRAFVRRDPFAGASYDRVAMQPPHAVEFSAAERSSDSDDVVVPDIATGDAGSTRTEDATRLSVRATIAGPRPVAYLADGASLQIVRIGDVIEGRRVASIDIGGVAFVDGTRLDLDSAGRERPASTTVPHHGSIAKQRRPTPRDRPIATAAPLAIPSSPEVTPGPLRTVDTRGLPPGTNPTPDALDPTALPYPYPYPPVAH